MTTLKEAIRGDLRRAPKPNLVKITLPVTLAVALIGLAALSAPVPPASASVASAPVESPAVRKARQQALADYAEQAIIPAHEQLASQAGQLVDAAAAFEKVADNTSLLQLREQRLQTAQAVAAGQAVAFGPIHSLGLDKALDFPIDEAGIDLTLQALDSASLDDMLQARSTPSLGGLQAVAYLLRSDDADSYNDPTRRYLHAQAERMEQAASELLAVWREGYDGQAPYAQVLATAGNPDNSAYLTTHSAIEEVVRAWHGTLDVLVGEALPEAQSDVATLHSPDGRATLAVLAATAEGLHTAYGAANLEPWFATVDAQAQQSIDSALSDAAKTLAELNPDPANTDLAQGVLEQATGSLEQALALIETTLLPTGTDPEQLASADAKSIEAIGGATTAWNRTSAAFEEAAPNLSEQAIADHDHGDEAFEESFVLGADQPNAGLGPHFNNTACVGCHVRNGRGMPVPGQLLVRVSDLVPDTVSELAEEEETPEARGETSPVAALGAQIQDFAVAGESPEATVDIEWLEKQGTYPDGNAYSLRSPSFRIELASNGELLPDTAQISPRIPPPVFGLGLLEAISETDVLALADPDDVNGDGISGRPNLVWNEKLQDHTLGRFGWKANSPNLLQQTADAYLNDMGVHSPMFPAEDGSSEIDEATLMAATAYSQTLAVPARAAVYHPQVQLGELLFADVGCNSCHVESFITSKHEYPALSDQPIHPYTDLLLHDMGEGLADGRADFEATGVEWRTPPLWGIGLAQTVLPYSGFLHDGRARTLEEAILWHGGEAEAATERFKALASNDRSALIHFLSSL